MAQHPTILSFLSASLSPQTKQSKVAAHCHEPRNGMKAVLIVTVLRWMERERMHAFNAGRLTLFPLYVSLWICNLVYGYVS